MGMNKYALTKKQEAELEKLELPVNETSSEEEGGSSNLMTILIIVFVIIGLLVTAIDAFFPTFFADMFQSMETKLNTHW